MSSGTGGSHTYRRRGPVSTGRSTSSVDTNVLLQRAGDTGMDTARSGVSVDTDVLLGDLEEAGRVCITDSNSVDHAKSSTSPSHRGGRKSSILTDAQLQAEMSTLSTGTEAELNFTSPSIGSANYTSAQPESSHHLPHSSLAAGHLARDIASQVVTDSKNELYHVDGCLVTDRSVASSGCATVDYDHDVLPDDVRYRHHSSGFEVSMSNKRQLSEDCSSASNDHNLGCVDSSGFEVSAVPEGGAPVTIHHNGSSGLEAAMLDERCVSENVDSLYQVTARSDSSLDAALWARDSTFSPATADDCPPVDSGTTSRTLLSVDTNVLLQTTEDVVQAMEAARTNHHSHTVSRDDQSPPTRNDSGLSYEDVDRNMPHARADVGLHYSDADYETETTENTRVVPPRSSVITKPPLVNGKSHINTAASYGRHGTKEAWGNRDIPEDVGTSGQKTYGHRTMEPLPKRAAKGDFGRRTDLVGRSRTVVRPELEHKRYKERLRSSPGTRTYPGQDSERSLASSASLGEKIVARSRQTQRPTSSKAARTSNSLAKNNLEQRQQQ